MSLSRPRHAGMPGADALANGNVLVVARHTSVREESVRPLGAPVVVRWNSKTRSWASRPADAEFGVVFLSTNDATATPPTDPNVQPGDLWRRHPDAAPA
jgi:hypothetical protein